MPSKQTRQRRQLIKQVTEMWQWRCLEKWGRVCEFCGKPAVQIHHFHRKSQFGHLRFDLDNGIVVCQGCHLIKAETPLGIEELRRKRGEEWYERIMEKAKNRPENFKANLTWLQSQIQKYANSSQRF